MTLAEQKWAEEEATRMTGIEPIRTVEFLPAIPEVGTAAEWGEPDDWQQAVEVHRVNGKVISSNAANKKERGTVSKRPSAAATEAEYEGTYNREDIEMDEDTEMVRLNDQNAVEAEAGTKAAVIVRLPDGETEDAFTWVESAFNDHFAPLDPKTTRLDEDSARKIRTWLANLFIAGRYDADGNWERDHVLSVGKFGAAVTGHFTVEGYHDTDLLDTDYLAWVGIPANHILASKGERGVLVKFHPTDRGEPSKNGKTYPRLDRRTVVGYRKFRTVDELEAHQDTTLRALAAIRRASTAAERADSTGSTESADERAAAQF